MATHYFGSLIRVGGVSNLAFIVIRGFNYLDYLPGHSILSTSVVAGYIFFHLISDS